MIPLRRVTGPTVEVLEALLASPEPVWGLKIIKQTDRLPGTVYPILERLESQGWITSSWEGDGPRTGPRRRLHALTPEGRQAALDACHVYRRKFVAGPQGQVATS